MTVALGSRRCPVMGCRRDRHVSPTGIHYGFCLIHSVRLLADAFGNDQQGGGRPVRFPVAPRSSASLPVADAHRPAA